MTFSHRDEPRTETNSRKIRQVRKWPHSHTVRAAAIDGAADRLKHQCEWAAVHYHPYSLHWLVMFMIL